MLSGLIFLILENLNEIGGHLSEFWENFGRLDDQTLFGNGTKVVCDRWIDHLVIPEVVSTDLMSNDNEIQTVYVYGGLVRFNKIHAV